MIEKVIRTSVEGCDANGVSAEKVVQKFGDFTGPRALVEGMDCFLQLLAMGKHCKLLVCLEGGHEMTFARVVSREESQGIFVAAIWPMK
ncbi:MAG TPA: hypothetical protein VMA75_03385 [Candidatus Paceibacterota bacterium]|nr:hypothetical protein [Candidatus Paceibacterota bacterium]